MTAAELHSNSVLTKNSEHKKGALMNVVEPEYLIDTFLKNPPLDFSAIQVADAGTCALTADAAAAWERRDPAGSYGLTPAFKADFDLLTTMDEDELGLRKLAQKHKIVKKLVTYPALFVGTTATEYANYPERTDYRSLISSLLHEMRKQKAQLLIVKDVPQNSPLLSATENACAEQLMKQCEEAGFLLVEGQALAYVHVDFSSVDEFMMRLSKSRRKEFRKKLKESAHVQMETLKCGAPEFRNEEFLDQLYSMYENVYQQSEIHFDILSRGFFRDLLQCETGGGIVFCYKVDGRLIGYNICFEHAGRLVDKYVGFVYPDARDANLYFMSWFKNLEYAISNRLEYYIAGWTDPAVKASLGARFTLTRHAVFIRNPILRAILTPFKHMFESDSNWIEKQKEND
ncbi:MAG: GNAT family N-acetyltransferase [Candidatus Obscuribacterales bacterium]|nr:GNAT family N-acetyltransferase [Candidatus Obscuribacterales bacterium]